MKVNLPEVRVQVSNGHSQLILYQLRFICELTLLIVQSTCLLSERRKLNNFRLQFILTKLSCANLCRTPNPDTSPDRS